MYNCAYSSLPQSLRVDWIESFTASFIYLNNTALPCYRHVFQRTKFPLWCVLWSLFGLECFQVSNASICRQKLNARSAQKNKLQELQRMFTVLQNQALAVLKQSRRYFVEFYFLRLT